MENKKEPLVNTHILFRKIIYDRLKIVKKDTNKSINWLVNIFLDARFKEFAKHVKYVDEKQGEEIKKEILKLSNDIQGVRRDLDGACRNFNQVSRNSNIMKKKQFVPKAISFEVTPEMRHVNYDPGHLDYVKKSYKNAVESGADYETLNSIMRRIIAEANGINIDDVPEQVIEYSETKVLLTEDELRDAFVDVDKARKVNDMILNSTEKLAEIMTQLL